MTTGEFADLVGRMRGAQILAAKMRTPVASLEAIRLEREVDRILLERLQRTTSPQQNLPLEGGKHEQANQYPDTNTAMASGRDSPEPSSPSDAAAGNEQPRAVKIGQYTGEESQPPDIW